jgi:hypothetical protein
LFVADTNESLNRSTTTFGTKAGKSLGVFAFGNNRLSYQLGRCDRTLTASAMQSDGNDVSINISPP